MTGWRLGLDGRAGAPRRQRSSGCSRTCTSAPRTSRRWPVSPRSTAPTSSTSTSSGTRRTGRCCSTGCAPPASTGSRRPTARSTSTPTCPHLTAAVRGDSMALCRRWLDELGVAATPGIDFDLARGDRFVRFSYAGDTATLAAACDRLERMASVSDAASRGPLADVRVLDLIDGDRRTELRALPGRLRCRRHQGRAPRRRQPAQHGLARSARRRGAVVEGASTAASGRSSST